MKDGKDWDNKRKDFHERLLEGINIFPEEIFEEEIFYSNIMLFFDGRKIKGKGFKKFIHLFNIQSVNDYKQLIAGKKIITYEGKKFSLFSFIVEYRNLFFSIENIIEFLEFLYLDNRFNLYVKIICSIEYNNKKPDLLSVGQRGTFYICLKLATDAFTSPFVFDQPEDDLDNDFIMKKLVPIFKEIKKYRQVIIATHNANFVVNTDVEQVIIATNKDENLQYYCGSLEGHLGKSKGNCNASDDIIQNTVYENVCNLLEGGKEAFLARKMKYSI